MSEISASIEESIKIESVKTGYKQLPGVAFMCFISAPVVAYLFYEKVDSQIILYWLFSVYVFCSAVPLLLYYFYSKSSDIDINLIKWRRLFLIAGILSGGSWGVSSWAFFMPNELEFQLLLFFILYIAAAAIMASTAVYPASFYVVVLPLLIPIAIRNVFEFQVINYALAIFTILYLGGLIFFQRNIHKSLIEAIKLQKKNKSLADTLDTKLIEMEKILKSKARFIAAASHDLRQPLHASSLFLAELSSQSISLKNRKLISHLNAMNLNMREMLDTLLDISQLDADEVNTSLGVFALRPLVESIHHEYEALMKQKDIHFVVIGSDYEVESDIDLLRRIIRNLVSNAYKYTSQGRVVLRIRKRKSHIRLDVMDSGIGIAKKYQSKIFDEYIRLEKRPSSGGSNAVAISSNMGSSMGLGLSICKGMCEALDIHLYLKSQYAIGSCFSLNIPLSKKIINNQPCLPENVNVFQKKMLKLAVEKA